MRPLAAWAGAVLGAGALWGASASADEFSTTVRASRDDAAAVSVVELGLPGERGAPSAYKSSLAQVLQGQPGLQVRSAGGLGQWSGAILRGADAAQVQILVDGVPLSRGGQAAIDLSQLAVDGFERVEIYRSLPPLEVGIDAVGGAINLISRRGRSEPATWAMAGAGSFGLRKATVGHVGGGDGPLRMAVTASYQGAQGDFPYLADGGLLYRGELVELQRRNDDFDQANLDLRVHRDSVRGGFFVSAHGLLKWQGVAGIGQADAQPGRPRMQMGRSLLSFGGHRRWLEGRMVWQGDGHVLAEGSTLRDLQSVPASNFEQLGVQAGVRSVASLSSATRTAGGKPQRQISVLADARYEGFFSFDLCPAPKRSCAGSAPTQSERYRIATGMGGELRLHEDRVLVQPAVHLLFARSRLRPTAGSVDADSQYESDALFVAPRAAMRVQALSWLQLRAGGGRFVRLPTFLELFGDRAFFRPNLELRPESSWTFELGGRIEPPMRRALRLSLEGHGFARQIDDLIDVIRDGTTLRARNVGQAIAAGTEWELQLHVADVAAVQASYSFLSAYDQTSVPGRGGNVLPGRPAHSLFARADVGYRGWRIGYELDYRSSIYLDPANGRPRPARVLHALSLHSGPHGRMHLTLSIDIRNLADTRSVAIALPLDGSMLRQVPLSDLYDYPLPGRAMYASLGGRL